MKTIEGNKFLHVFMGHKVYQNGVQWASFKYDSSWDWLMPVVEKINGMYHRITIEGNEEEDRCTVLCYDDNGKLDNEVYECGLNLLEATYKAVIKFIEWYNTQNK